MVNLFRWLAEIPLVASAIVTTVVWVVWRGGWWPYQLTLLLMSASVIFKAAMADWTRASHAIEPYPVPIRWSIERDARIVWSTVRHE